MSPERLRAVTSVLDRPTAPFGAAANLVCRECGASYDLGPGNACELCFGPLEIGYDERFLASVTREAIEPGPRAMCPSGGLPPATPLVGLEDGLSRLHRADNR